MDVVDLHDFVSLILGNRRRTAMDRNITKNIQKTQLTTAASSDSSLTLPMTQPTTNIDLEKVGTDKVATHENPIQRTVTAQDWTGDDDPDNSENWSTGKKVYHVAYIGLQCFIMYVTIFR